MLPALRRPVLRALLLPPQIEREKLHGCIDVGLSVMSVKKSTKCIDLDTEEHIYHLKVSPPGCRHHGRAAACCSAVLLTVPFEDF